MTAPAVPLATSDLMESMYGLTPAILKMSADEYARRLSLWEQQAAVQAGAAPAYAPVYARILALRSWAVQLMGQADKFRAEDDITVERDILGRVALINGWLKEAQAELPPATPNNGPRRTANPAPEFQEWGLRR